MTATNDLLKRIAFAVLGVSLIAYGLWIQSGEPTVAKGARSASNKASATGTTAQPSLVKIPIKDMRVGTRVPAFNPEVSAKERAGFREPNWYQWMKLRLEMPKPDGTMLEIEMLRSEEWLIQQMAVVVQPESIMLPAYSEAERSAASASALSEPSSLGSHAIAAANNAATMEATVTETTFTESRSSEARSSEATPSDGFGVPLRPIYFHLASLLGEVAAGGDEVLGLVVQLDLPELGLSGPAWIVDLEPAPITPPGPGQVVTATFKHASANVLDLVLTNTPPTTQTTSHSTQPSSYSAINTSHSVPVASHSEPSDQPTESIGVTANHPFWSIDRAEFVQAGELTIGERLQTLAGDIHWVQQKLPRPGPEPVYNLEVHAEHVYYVGTNGILAHNAGSEYGKSRLNILNPHFAPDPVRVLQNVTNQAVSELATNPSIAKGLMSSGSYMHLVRGSKLSHASYGKAVERLTADIVKNDSLLSSILEYRSRPFRSTPDFFGWDGFNLFLIDITTLKSIPKHLARSYGPATRYVTHPGMPLNVMFPK